jgi:exoribonuclease R
VPSPRLVYTLTDAAVTEGLAVLRRELHIADDFPAEVAAAAARAARRRFTATEGRVDATDISFVTIDPAGSTDLDQAYHAERTPQGYRVHYAIADVAAFVEPGSPVDAEALERGVTLYAPDRRAPLYPEVLSEGAASLLPHGDRPALLWTIDVATDGTLGDAHVARALVRSREQLSYDEAQARIDAGTAAEPLLLLKEIGLARAAQEVARGAVSLSLPEQQLDRVNGGYRLGFRATLPVEQWNAQISLLTGIAAARLMIAGRIGLVRTLPEPNDDTVATLRRAARALHIDWPTSMSYADRIRSLDPSKHREAALMHQAARLFRGAGYLAFDGEVPEHATHSAIASTYAHVTAPLRRVGDRYANEVVLALCAGRPVPDDVRAALPTLPAVLGRAQQRQGALDRGALDLAETLVMHDHVGDVFDAAVVNLDQRRAVIEITEPAIVSELDPDGLALGSEVQVRLMGVDPVTRSLRFERATTAPRTATR